MCARLPPSVYHSIICSAEGAAEDTKYNFNIHKVCARRACVCVCARACTIQTYYHDDGVMGRKSLRDGERAPLFDTQFTRSQQLYYIPRAAALWYESAINTYPARRRVCVCVRYSIVKGDHQK